MGIQQHFIKENDKWEAAFTCFCGSFEPLVMYFRLCNLPATFQAMMNEIFADILHLFQTLHQHFDGKDLAAALMKALNEEFTSVGIAVAYALLKSYWTCTFQTCPTQHLPLARWRCCSCNSKLLAMNSMRNVRP